VTSAWLSKVLGGDVEIASVDRIGDGLVGMNLRVVLTATDPGLPSSVVIKLPSPDDTSRSTAIALRNYERESKFYAEIAATVDIHVPKCYLSEWDELDHDFAIVLEDVAPAEQGDQVTGCTVERARTAVLELAKLHGPRWDDPTLADFEFLSRRTTKEDSMMLGAMWTMLYPGFISIFDKYLTPDAVGLLERFGPHVSTWAEGRSGPLAVVHGDYRLDNLLFASGSGGAPITAVDWQTAGHGPPVADVSYFLGAGPLPHDRRKIERELVSEYAEELRRTYGVELDDGWLWQQYAREAFSGVIMAVIASQIVGVTERSEAMFAAMATRHLQHALDLDSEALI